MAIHNEILDGQLNELLTRRLSMKGGAPAPALNPEIWPGLVIESDRPEWGWLKRELPWGVAGLEVGQAAELSMGALRNPDGSGMIAVVTLVGFEVNTTSRVELAVVSIASIPASALADTYTPLPRDGRALSTKPVCLVTSGEQVAGGITLPLHIFAESAGRMSFYTQPVILTPGTALLWEGDTNNVQTRFSFHWTERRALNSELV